MTVPALAPGRIDLELYRPTSYWLMYQFTHRLGQAGCPGEHPAFALAFSPDGKWFALAIKDKQISLLSSVGQVDFTQ
jgi:hypothetical protein